MRVHYSFSRRSDMRIQLTFEELDVVTRLGIYMLSNPTPSFAPLLRPLFAPQALQDTILVMLLDWRNPWNWLRQIRRWIRLLRDLFFDLDDDAKLALEEVMKACMSNLEIPRRTF